LPNLLLQFFPLFYTGKNSGKIIITQQFNLLFFEKQKNAAIIDSTTIDYNNNCILSIKKHLFLSFIDSNSINNFNFYKKQISFNAFFQIKYVFFVFMTYLISKSLLKCNFFASICFFGFYYF